MELMKTVGFQICLRPILVPKLGFDGRTQPSSRDILSSSRRADPARGFAGEIPPLLPPARFRRHHTSWYFVGAGGKTDTTSFHKRMADNGSDNRYTPGPDFTEDNSGPSLPISLSDSTELWLIQWPLDQLQPVDFHRKALSLKLRKDGRLGSFENSSGKSYEVVSFSAQKPDATVFLRSSSGSKVVGKISRRACLVHYPEPGEFDMPAVSGLNTSGSKFQGSMMKKLSHLSSIHKKTSSTGADRSTETFSGGHSIGHGIQGTPVEQSRKKRNGILATASEATRSIGQSSLASVPESQLTSTTIGSKQSHGKKTKTKKLKT